MRQLPNETYESWVERVRAFELEQARKEIRKGADINLVMEAMSARIMKKLIHPLMLEIRKNADAVYDPEESRRRYAEAMSRHKPVADHVDDNATKKVDDDW